MKKLLLSTSAFALMGSMASAADLYSSPAVVEAPAYVAEQFSWNGLYFGGSVGYARHERSGSPLSCDDTGVNSRGLQGQIANDISSFLSAYGLEDFGFVLDRPSDAECQPSEDGVFTSNDSVAAWSETDAENDGWMASGFLGVNRQYGQFVVGTELEGTWLSPLDNNSLFAWVHTEANDQESLEIPQEVLALGLGGFETSGPDWMAQGTAKAGFLMGSKNQTLLYVKGGFAVADTQTSDFLGGGYPDEGPYPGNFLGYSGEGITCEEDGDFNVCSNSKESGYGFGGTVGAGVEHKFTQNFSVGAEYQATFINYSGSHDVTARVRDFSGGDKETTFSKPFEDIAIHAFKLKATWHLN